MDLLRLVEYLESDADDESMVNLYTTEEVLEAIADHKETLRNLQGSYGRMIAALEERGDI